MDKLDQLDKRIDDKHREGEALHTAYVNLLSKLQREVGTVLSNAQRLSSKLDV